MNRFGLWTEGGPDLLNDPEKHKALEKRMEANAREQFVDSVAREIWIRYCSTNVGNNVSDMPTSWAYGKAEELAIEKEKR